MIIFRIELHFLKVLGLNCTFVTSFMNSNALIPCFFEFLLRLVLHLGGKMLLFHEVCASMNLYSYVHSCGDPLPLLFLSAK